MERRPAHGTHDVKGMNQERNTLQHGAMRLSANDLLVNMSWIGLPERGIRGGEREKEKTERERERGRKDRVGEEKEAR